MTRDPRPHLEAPAGHGPGGDEAAAFDRAGVPELVEVLGEAHGQLAGLRDHDHVLLSQPRVFGPVGRARPDRLVVAHDVLVVHQVRHTGDRPDGHLEGRDQHPVGLGRRRHGDRVPVVEVVDESHSHPSRRGRLDRAADDPGRAAVEVEVVVGEVQRRPGTAHKGGDLLRHRDGGLAPVGQSSHLEHAAHLPGCRRLRGRRGLVVGPELARRGCAGDGDTGSREPGDHPRCSAAPRLRRYSDTHAYLLGSVSF